MTAARRDTSPPPAGKHASPRRRPAILGGPPAFPAGLAFARPLTPPLEAVVARLAPSYDRGILTNGPLVRALEEAAAARLGVAHAVAVASCTSGLILSLQALACRAGVVLPSFTFSASAHAVAWNGLRPVFAECDPHSLQVDVDDVRRRIDGAGWTPGEGAVMATHVSGLPAPAEALEQVAAEARVPLVFDAAHAFGARRQGRPVGGFGDVEVFSMSPTKLVVAGEGGIVATNRDDVAEAVRLGRDYGNPGDYDCRFVGLNARLSELHAATALESLGLLDQHLALRRRIAAAYATGVADLPGIALQQADPGDEPSWKDVTAIVDAARFGLRRDAVVTSLRAEGIDVRCYFSPPVHLQRSYAGADVPPLPVTERISRAVVSLPVHVGVDDAAVERVSEVLHDLHAHAEEVAAALDASDGGRADGPRSGGA